MTLALVIETVTGHSYGDYLRQNIFTPLDMQDSFTDPAKASAHGLSDGHTWWFGFPFESLEGPRPDMLGAGYILVSPEDMSHYLIAQLSDGVYEEAQILSPENIDAMHTPAQLPEGASVYGMGWVSYDEDGLSVVNHNGQSASFTCSMILLPERGIGIAVLTNVSSLLGPHAAWSLADNVKNILVTGQPARADSAFRDFYLPWDGGFLLATGALLWSLISMLFRGQKIAKSQSRWRVALSFFVDGLLMLVAFFGLPLVLGWTKWRGMFVWQPDAVYWCLWAGILLLAKMSLRAAILVRRGKQNHS